MTEKHTANKKDNNILKNRNKTFLWWICTPIIVISIVEIIFTGALLWFLYTDKISANTFDSSMESSLLTSGIAIIGAAIAVWAGLNIANAIERNEYEKLKEKTDTLAEALEEKSQDVAQLVNVIDQGTTQFRELEKKDAQRSAKYEELEKIALLNELSMTSNDAATRQLMKIVNTYKLGTGFPIAELVMLERYFRLVYKKHSSKFHKDIELLTYVDEGIRIANSLLALTTNEELRAYILFRKAELLFYSGYCLSGNEKRIAFEEAIQLYFESANKLNANLPDFKELVEFKKITYEGCSLNQVEISAYMCNTIGEAYSKIIESLAKDDVLFDEYGHKAIFYCAYAAYWNNKELYLRNLGCAIERHRGVTDKTYDELFEIYQNTISINATSKTFKVLLSVADKFINYYIGIKEVDIKKGRETPLNNELYIVNWQNLEQSTKDRLLSILSMMRDNSILAKTIHPSEEVGYVYSCIYHRDMCVINANQSSIAKKHLLEAKRNFSILKVINPTGALTKILSDDLDALS